MIHLKANPNRIFQFSILSLMALNPFFYLCTTISAEPAKTDESLGNRPTEMVEKKFTEEDAVRELVQILEEQTKIATKTKMNIDFVPGFVSVVHGKDLLARGVRTVYEALELIPGIDIRATHIGAKIFQIRGISQYKLLLNGISLNPTVSAAFTTLLSIPMEQVDRIEVIRGPGSAIYGEFAYTGVVDIITRENTNMLFGRYGSFHTPTAGGIFSYQNKEKGIKLSLNASGMRSDGGDVQAGMDILYLLGQGNISNAPGPTNEKEENTSAIFKLEYKGFSLTGQYLRSGYGDYFGLMNALPPDGKRIVSKEQNIAIEMRQRLDLSDHFLPTLKVGLSEFIAKGNEAVLYPLGFIGISPITGLPIFYPDGMIYKGNYRERKLYGGAELNYKKIKDQDLLIGIEFSSVRGFDSWVETNFDPQTREPVLWPIRFSGIKGLFPDEMKRNIWSVYLQDQYFLTERLMITGGLRYDYYNDVGGSINPRIALSYQFTDRQIIKFQFAKAFRPPTFAEMYAQNNSVANGNPDIDPETIYTFELGHIYKRGPFILRTNLFYSFLRNLIWIDQQRYFNSRHAQLRGGEVEMVAQIHRMAKLDLNLSYVYARDQDANTDLENVVNLMGNAGLIIQPWPNLSIALHDRFVGRRTRRFDDWRNPLSHYNTVDFTVSAFNLGIKGLALRGGIKNLFDDEVIYPAPVNTYIGDLPRPGRQWWLALSYEF